MYTKENIETPLCWLSEILRNKQNSYACCIFVATLVYLYQFLSFVQIAYFIQYGLFPSKNLLKLSKMHFIMHVL